MSDFIKRNGYVLFFLGFIAVVGFGMLELLQYLPEPPPVPPK